VYESFKGYEVQFSSDMSFKSKVAVPATQSALTPTKPTWQKILSIPGKLGGNAYWRVVGKRSNNTIATSEIGYITVGPPQPVLDAEFSPLPIRKSVPPLLTWNNNYNIKFKVYVANDSDFSKPGIKKYVSPLINDDPCADGGELYAPLTASQWASVWVAVKVTPPTTIWWYVESWDILGRTAKTDVMSFVLEP
jgi:hypothetical protein